MVPDSENLGDQDSLSRRAFYIFGNNISRALSPIIHNTAFAKYGLQYHYAIHPTLRIDESVVKLIRQPDFGGASVTFPHKLQVQPLLDTISGLAEALGAVNTIIVEESPSGKQLRGDNTDWLGILNCMQQFPQSNPVGAIVIGAGGAARAAVYALQQTGYEDIVIVNRTRRTAENLAKNFPGLQFTLHTSLTQVSQAANIIIGCIPADDVVESDIPQRIFAPGAGIVIEMSYRPAISALMRVARRQQDWHVFGGVDVLKEQAYVQFKLWTGKDAPIQAIEEALVVATNDRRS